MLLPAPPWSQRLPSHIRSTRSHATLPCLCTRCPVCAKARLPTWRTLGASRQKAELAAPKGAEWAPAVQGDGTHPHPGTLPTRGRLRPAMGRECRQNCQVRVLLLSDKKGEESSSGHRHRAVGRFSCHSHTCTPAHACTHKASFT